MGFFFECARPQKFLDVVLARERAIALRGKFALVFFLGCGHLFFQAEDGIRDGRVTGVQTCALPISLRYANARRRGCGRAKRGAIRACRRSSSCPHFQTSTKVVCAPTGVMCWRCFTSFSFRSEERRVERVYILGVAGS